MVFKRPFAIPIISFRFNETVIYSTWQQLGPLTAQYNILFIWVKSMWFQAMQNLSHSSRKYGSIRLTGGRCCRR